MSGVSSYLTARAQWDYIVNALQAQQNVGTDGTPGTGTNTNGTLQSVQMVGDSIWPEFNSLPYVGVQLDEVNEVQLASQRRHQVIAKFSIIVCVNVPASGTNLIALSDAMRDLSGLIDDGSGNGVLPILGSSANFTLGGNAYQTLTTGAKLYWDKNPTGKGTDYIAYATLGLTSWQVMQRT